MARLFNINEMAIRNNWDVEIDGDKNLLIFYQNFIDHRGNEYRKIVYKVEL